MVELDLTSEARPELRVTGPAGEIAHPLSPRHAQVLSLLALAPGGRSAGELSVDLFGDAGHTVAVRAEVSRLRRQLGGVLDHRPYRFADGVEVRVRGPLS